MKLRFPMPSDSDGLRRMFPPLYCIVKTDHARNHSTDHHMHIVFSVCLTLLDILVLPFFFVSALTNNLPAQLCTHTKTDNQKLITGTDQPRNLLLFRCLQRYNDVKWAYIYYNTDVYVCTFMYVHTYMCQYICVSSQMNILHTNKHVRFCCINWLLSEVQRSAFSKQVAYKVLRYSNDVAA